MNKREYSKGRSASAVGAMLRQEVKLINAMSNIKLSPNILLELSKAVVVGMKKAIAVSNSIATIASVLQHQTGVESEDQISRDSSQLPLNKKEAEAEELAYAAMLAEQTGL